MEKDILNRAILGGRKKSTTQIKHIMSSTNEERDRVINAINELVVGNYLVIRDSQGNPIKHLSDDAKEHITAIQFTSIHIEATVHLQPSLEDQDEDDDKPLRIMRDQITTAKGDTVGMEINPEQAEGTDGHTGRYTLQIFEQDGTKRGNVLLDQVEDTYEKVWQLWSDWKAEALLP